MRRRLAASRLLPEPCSGLLGDEAEFASHAAPEETSATPHGYSRHLKAIQQHFLAVEGKHPPVYYFFCTVYYIPRESGFTAEEGFDMTPDTRLRRREFPKSFVNAVRMEGTCRLAEPGPQWREYISSPRC